jgi:hypothetical protein
MENQFFINLDGSIDGPFTSSDLRSLLTKSLVLPTTPARNSDQDPNLVSWRPLILLLDEASGQENSAPPIPAPPPATSTSLPEREVPSLARVALLGYPKIVGNAQKVETAQGPSSPFETEIDPVQMVPTTPDYTEVAHVGIAEGERKKLWRLFWLCAVGAFLANASIIVILFILGFSGLLPMAIAAVPNFLIWSKLAASIEKYKALTGISYPGTYVVLAIGSIIGFLGPLMMLISFWIHIRRIPNSNSSGVEEPELQSGSGDNAASPERGMVHFQDSAIGIPAVKPREKVKPGITDRAASCGSKIATFIVIIVWVFAVILAVIAILSMVEVP